MSRIGKKAVALPSGVSATVDGQTVTIKGPKGQLSWTVADEIAIAQGDDGLSFTPRNDSQRAKAMWGLSRTLIANMVHGVTQGYAVTLEIQGVGYRAQKQGQKLAIQLGFSHPVELDPPPGITLEAPQPNRIIVSGIDKELVGQIAAGIRALREPDPYKGKGIRYLGEHVRRKAGKAGKAAAGAGGAKA